MIIKNALIFVDDKFRKLDFEFFGDKITRVEENISGEEWISKEGSLLIPGLIDIHTHGRGGFDFSTASPKEIAHLLISYAECGVTSVLATTMTMDMEVMRNIMMNHKKAMSANNPGCRILGINMEGPFLGKDRKGCHDEHFLIDLNEEQFEILDVLSGGNIRILDLDPNLAGSLSFIGKYAKEKTISLAHTSATYHLACEAVGAGARHVTHLFNAMNSLHHREPGLIGMVCDLPVTAELVCDGIHIHPSVIRMMFRLIPDRIVIVSDSLSAAGVGEGEYELGGLKVYVRDNKATLKDGTIACSTADMLQEVRNVISFGIPIEQAILAATRNPARAIRMEHEVGELKPGRKADFLVVSPKMDLEQVYIGGERFR
jgi:N-acetylglucosamine-6-phosphate deacetylase